ncbi:hypothetical protein CR513_14539, partial [Mucuna pruriens]
MQVGQLADTVSQIQLICSGMIPSQTIRNPKRGGVGMVRLRSDRDRSSLNRVHDQSKPRPNREPTLDCNNRPRVFHYLSTKRSEIDEDLLKLFRKVEINILLLDAIKQILKYVKFLKELYIHRRKKMKGTVKMGGVMLSYQSRNSTNFAEEVSRSSHIRGSMHHRWSYIHQCHVGPWSLDQRNASINIQVAQPWGSGVDKDGDPTCQLKCCATPRRSRRRTSPSQQVDFPSRCLHVEYGG